MGTRWISCRVSPLSLAPPRLMSSSKKGVALCERPSGRIVVEGAERREVYLRRRNRDAGHVPRPDGSSQNRPTSGTSLTGASTVWRRSKDLNILRGRNYYPQDIEKINLRHRRPFARTSQVAGVHLRTIRVESDPRRRPPRGTSARVVAASQQVQVSAQDADGARAIVSAVQEADGLEGDEVPLLRRAELPRPPAAKLRSKKNPKLRPRRRHAAACYGT